MINSFALVTLLAGFEYGYDREDNRLFERRLHEGSDTGDTYRYDSAYRLVDFRRDVVAPAGAASTARDSETRARTLDGVGNWRTLAITEAGKDQGRGHDRDGDGSEDHRHTCSDSAIRRRRVSSG